MDHSLHEEAPSGAHKSGMAELRSKADHGDADAQFSLGLHYGSAPVGTLDLEQAARWYRKAADQEHTLAQYNLGVMFARGQGMPPDEATAEGWLRKAAEGGDAGGQHDLGTRCHRASLNALSPDAKESRIEAFKWFQLSALQGYGDSITARQRVTLTMSRAEVEEGNHRAAVFAVRKPVSPQTS